MTTLSTRRSGIVAAQIGNVIHTIALVVAGVIALAILLVAIDANPANMIVDTVTDIARWLATPFAGLIRVGGQTTTLIVNWGLAAIVYLLIGVLIGRALVGRGVRWRH
jgi:hypothetical protein